MVSRTHKLRGSRTHGRGKKHGRGNGGHGGTGNAGLHKHKFKTLVKYMPDHFGRHGFTRHAQMEDVVAIDLEQLLVRLPELESQGHAKRSDGAVEVNLTAAGVTKLLGGGQVRGAFKITVAAASEQARAKVQEAGGQVLLPGEAKE